MEKKSVSLVLCAEMMMVQVQINDEVVLTLEDVTECKVIMMKPSEMEKPN